MKRKMSLFVILEFMVTVFLLGFCLSGFADELTLQLEVPETTLAAGTSMKVVPSLSDESITKVKYVWETADKKVATVSNGIIRGVGEGTTTITCSTTIGEKLIQNSFGINVYVPVKSVAFKKKSIKLEVGNSETIEAKISPKNATNQKLSWKSDDTSVATVDENGKITAVYGGTCRISGTSCDGSDKSAMITVFVPSMSCPTEEVNLVLGKKSVVKVNLYTMNQSDIYYGDNDSLCDIHYPKLHDDVLEFHIVPWWQGQCVLTITDPNSPKSTIKIKLITSAENSLQKGFAKLDDKKYRDLLRYERSGDYIHFTGYVKQISYGANKNWMLIATKKKYDNYVYVEYDPSYNSSMPKLLEDDEVSIYGQSAGVYSYKTVSGTENFVPKIEPTSIGLRSENFVYHVSDYYSY